jgi:hypothetical protein
MKPFVIIAPKDGNISVEDIQEIMDKAYDQGYEDGKNSVMFNPWHYQTVPYYPSGTFVQSEPKRTEITC